MIPVDQREPDDCLRACLASVFEIPWEEAPDTGAGCRSPKRGESQESLVHEWLKQRGLIAWSISMREGNPPILRRGLELLRDGSSKPADFVWPFPFATYHLGSGISPRDSEKDHAVVMQLGKIVHDPHPDHNMTIDRIHTITVFLVCLEDGVGDVEFKS